MAAQHYFSPFHLAHFSSGLAFTLDMPGTCAFHFASYHTIGLIGVIGRIDADLLLRYEARGTFVKASNMIRLAA